MQARKKKWGDRKDGTWLRDIDALHAFTPYLMPRRTDNEAFITEQIDLENLQAYLYKRNAEPNDSFKYTLFHAVVAAFVKTIALRPRLNRFIKGNRLYERDGISVAFVMKKEFSDHAHEALIFINFDQHTTIDSVHARIKQEVTTYRTREVKDNSTEVMDTLVKLPRFILRIVVGILHLLDYYGRVPDVIVKEDPNHASLFVTNLGSIKLHSAYHHLNNWGTNSLFAVIGEKHFSPVYDREGFVGVREVLELGITADERIADGYYYAKSIKLLKHLLHNPELLELEAMEEINYE